MIPYGRQLIDEDDIKAVVDVLRSDYLTIGPKISEFEHAVANYSNAAYGVAVSSGTSALHCAMHALGIGPGDEVIVPAITFAASANCVIYQGGRPVFADVDPRTLLIDPEQIERKITKRTKAIIGVDYAGQPCDWNSLRDIAKRHGLKLIADGCHAIGAEYNKQKVGTLADMTVFSFHPVKHITTGEGGMIVTNHKSYAEKMRMFRSHGVKIDARQREKNNTWFYEMTELGYNYRITDIQCAIGISQLKKLDKWIAIRRKIASAYNSFFEKNKKAEPLMVNTDAKHVYHLYVVRISNRDVLFSTLREKGLGVNVHYIPVYLHPYYQEQFGYKKGLCPNAESAYDEILSLPIWAGMDDKDIETCLSIIDESL